MKTTANSLAVVLLCLATTTTFGADTTKNAKSDFSKVPGVVIYHSPASSKIYVGSPSITILPDGTYLASHDKFGPGRAGHKFSAFVYRSTDCGKTWKHISSVKSIHWPNIFHHRGATYLMGASAGRNPGSCVILKSTDRGETWTEPKDENSGVLRSGVAFHTATVPMCYHNGRIWRAMEDQANGGGWGHRFRAFMMSAPVNADLLKASSWTVSNALVRDPGWFGGQFRGWLEGNAVCGPDGKMVNLLRVNYEKGCRMSGKAAMIHVSDDGKNATFNPKTDFIDLPGGAKKFTIRYDKKSKAYWTLTNPCMGYLDRNAGKVRNTLALMRSKDLRNWEMRSILIHNPDVEKHGFQYPDWVFDGNDIVAAIRTSNADGLGGAHNYHDANFLTFHRFKNFRDLTMADSVIDPQEAGPAKPAKADLDAVTIEGRGFSIKPFGEGKRAFGNRKYVWKNVPKPFEGWRFTQTEGGVGAKMRVTAKRDATLYFATRIEYTNDNLSGWEQPPVGQTFYYSTTPTPTPMYIFHRKVKQGETIDLPCGDWIGGMLLAP